MPRLPRWYYSAYTLLMARELIVYCDESTKRGEFFSHFYGGILVESADYCNVARSLSEFKEKLGLHREVKWAKITSHYQKLYIDFIHHAFDFIRQGRLKVRVMFTQNRYEPLNLTAYHIEHEYFILYFQFLRHAFGFDHSNKTTEPLRLRVFLDRLPDSIEKAELFKGYLMGLNKTRAFKESNLTLHKEDIAEVESHSHVLIQVIDVIMGAMQFKLNDKHLAKPAGGHQRGSRTRAKENVYKAINKEICTLRPRFNVGKSTSDDGDPRNRWEQSYRHWVFIPKDFREKELSKKRR